MDVEKFILVLKEQFDEHENPDSASFMESKGCVISQNEATFIINLLKSEKWVSMEDEEPPLNEPVLLFHRKDRGPSWLRGKQLSGKRTSQIAVHLFDSTEFFVLKWFTHWKKLGTGPL